LEAIRAAANLQINEILRFVVHVYSSDPAHHFLVDELKVHPTDAQMRTAVYNPLWGVSAQATANDQNTEYIFDQFGRLVVVKNHQGEIKQQTEYHIQNQ
jgi:hypothetical protein